MPAPISTRVATLHDYIARSVSDSITSELLYLVTLCCVFLIMT